MSGTGNASDRTEPGEPLTPIEATRLWETYCSDPTGEGVQALDRLYRALRLPLVRLCRLKGCDSNAANDHVDEAWAKLMVKRPIARNFVSLIQKTVQNLIYKAHHRKQTLLLNVAEANEIADPFDQITKSETNDSVRRCLAQLTPTEQEFLIAVDVDGLSREAACVLVRWSVSSSTARKRHLRIQQQLKDWLEQEGVS